MTYQKWREGFIWTRNWLSKNRLDEMSKQDYAAGYQKVRMHPGETFEHFMVKAAISKILYDRGRSFIVEMPLTKNQKLVRKIDILDISEKNGHEVKVSSLSEGRSPDLNIIVSDTRTMPIKVRIAFSILQKWIEEKIP